ncbi:pseudouridine synthase [Mycoplasmopsis meleagridis]|uniref:pseudouridine synthase n=1 Tax=Mycoplasmopsis meleagridis TaxID=29561 RepID=UPI00073D7111|nr:pseudouridine synthase [Mycoplasmopsis meleagridis]KUH47272.1 hypothetical protein ASB56_02010 [Mycoplasmopsis meleagridis]
MNILKVISNYSSYSRKEAKKLIKTKQVKINEKIIDSATYNFDLEKDKLKINEISYMTDKYFYIALNKPKDYVCSHQDNHNKLVYDLLDKEIRNIKNLNTFGRLDKDTTGLIILSNDGSLNHFLTSAKRHILKKYIVEINRTISLEEIKIIEKGLFIGKNEYTKECKVEKINDLKMYLTLFEGKYHQIKRMFKALNYEVVNLHRIQFGKLVLDQNLRPKEYKFVKKEDLI